MEETKIIYYVDDEETPYLIKFQSPADQITLADFKNAINKPNYKFFFKSLDDDFGVVKEEITDDDTKLPCINGKVVSWLVVAEGSTQSDNHSSSGKEMINTESDAGRDKVASDSSDPKSPNIRNVTKLPSRPQTNSKKYDENRKVQKTKHKFTGPEKLNIDETDDTFDEIDSIYNADKVPPLRKFSDYKHNIKMKKIRPPGGTNGGLNNGTCNSGSKSQPIYESSSSMMSSDIDTTSFFDSEDESSRFSSATETTMSSKYGRQRRQLRRRRKMPHLSRASSFSSMTDSTVSLNIITVTLNMDAVPFLGISIVGQTNGSQENGDGGIYVGSIMKGGAVALDGRIEPGDMILEVNGISFENVSNEEAVRTLREQVQKPGPVTLVVAKSWDPNPSGYMLPQQDPVRPIDPRAWVLHTQAVGTMLPPPQQSVSCTGDQFTHGGNYLPYAGVLSTVASTITTTSSSIKSSSVVEVQNPSKNFFSRIDDPIPCPLTITHDPNIIIRAMKQPDSGLPIRDRLWLKITIFNAFIGSDLVDWLYTHVQGFSDRKDARKFGANLLKSGHIRHTVNKSVFSEQCYYVLNELNTAMSSLNLDSEIDSVSVVAGQQVKARLMHPEMGSKESPVLSSGFQSACSNKWSNFNPQSNPVQEIHSTVPFSGPNVYSIQTNNYKNQNFYSENMQPLSQPPIKTISNLSHGLSSNLKSNRGPGSVHSGSVVAKNCMCLQSMGVFKAVKHFWEGTNKPVTLVAANSGSGGTIMNSRSNFVDNESIVRTNNVTSETIRDDHISTVSANSNTCCICGGEQDESDPSSSKPTTEESGKMSVKISHHCPTTDVTPTTSGSSASGSSSNVTRNMNIPVYHLQNQQPGLVGMVIPDSNHHPSYNTPPPSYQQSLNMGSGLSKCQPPNLPFDIGSNQLSAMQNENSSSGFFSDGIDKCD